MKQVDGGNERTTAEPVVHGLLNAAESCRLEGRADLASLLGNAGRALAYYSAVLQQRPPSWVPSRVRLPRLVHGDGPFRSTFAAAGEWDCECNRWGAVSVRAANGQVLGLKPAEFMPVAWVLNGSAGR